MERENQTIEYKREYTDEIKKTIIAFANTVGGKIYVGINDDLSVCGVNDPDETMLNLTNMARDSIKPDVTMFLNYDTQEIDGKSVVVLEVQKGVACPYYIASKGIRPEGVFVRQGASSVPTTETAIIKMIKETSGDDYEDVRSREQNLTFEDCTKEFSLATLKLEREQMRTLNFIGADGLYSNLACLLSDQCVHTIKAAVFEGTSKMIFKDRFEFSGSLFKQMRECFEFIDRNNRVRAEIDGLTRIDNRDYPQIAIREALLNALVHRDYSFSGSTLVSIFDNRIEIVTIGGLLRGISMEDMVLGVSVLRNKNLANVFYRLKLIEAYGTGVLKMMESYDDYPQIKPLIETTDSAFKITLYNTNYKHETEVEVKPQSLTKTEIKIVDHFKDLGNFRRADVEKLIGISRTMATKHLKSLVEKGSLNTQGKGKNVVYEVKGNGSGDI